MEGIIRGFGLNISVLLGLALVFFLFSETITLQRERRVLTSGHDLIFGALLAGIGLLVMATPVNFGQGVVFDTRTILIGLAAAFFGWLPALIAALACVAYRLYQGGIGTIPGILTILTALSCGLIWRHWRGKDLIKVGYCELAALGAAIHILVVFILLVFLVDQRQAILGLIAPVFLLLYPLVYAGLGLLMRHRYRLEVERLEFDKSRDYYRSLFQNNHLPMLLMNPASGSIVDANPAAESFYGWSCRELQQMNVTDLNVMDPAQLVILMSQASQAEANEFEFQHRLRDGSIREVLVRSGPVEIEGQQLLYSIIADQSESKRLLAALRESEAQAREFVSAVERCRVSIVFTDPDGCIEYVNPYFCKLTGYTADEVLGHNPSILSSGVQSKQFYQEMWDHIKAGQVWEGEFCNRRKDGSHYWELAVIAPIRNTRGGIEKFVGVKHDITAQKAHAQALEAALRQAEAGSRAKAAFISVISHELRTPLNHILGPTELVAEDLPPGESKELLETSIKAARHLSELMLRIIRFSELGGQPESQLQQIDDPARWLECALKPYAEIAREKGSTLAAAVSPDFPEVFAADEAALAEILTILVDNAFEHAAPGSIRVELAYQQPHARLAVIDPGPALSEADKARLFQPFQQLDMSHTRQHPGMGLGLSLCRRYADRCGGSIEVNTDPGGGNRFEFVFPVSTSAPEISINKSNAGSSLDRDNSQLKVTK